MPTFKHIWRFQGSNGGTWSEIWYRDASAINSELTLPTSLINARLNLVDGTSKWLSDNVSQVGSPRITGINLIGLAGKDVTSLTGPNAGPAALGWAAVINCAGQQGGSKRWMLRGWSDGDFYRDPNTGVDNVLPSRLKLLNRIQNELQNANFGILRLQASSNVLNPYLPIVSIDGSRNDGTTDLHTSVVAGFAAPTRIIVGQTSKKDVPALNGHWTVIATKPRTAPLVGTIFTIQYRTPNNQLIPNPVGRLRQEIYLGTSVLSSVATGFSHLGTRTTRGGYRTSRGAKRAARIRGLA